MAKNIGLYTKKLNYENAKTEGVNDEQNKTDVRKLTKRKQDSLTSRLRKR